MACVRHLPRSPTSEARLGVRSWECWAQNLRCGLRLPVCYRFSRFIRVPGVVSHLWEITGFNSRRVSDDATTSILCMLEGLGFGTISGPACTYVDAAFYSSSVLVTYLYLGHVAVGVDLSVPCWYTEPGVGVSYCIWRHHGLSAPEGWSSSRVRRQTNVPYNSNAQDVYSVI